MESSVETAPPRQTTPFLVLQFFIFPMAIVAVCVTVFVVFGLISSGPKDPRAILNEVRTGGGMFNIKRWQAAYALANVLETEKDLARRDPGFVDEVVKLYRETAKSQDDDALVRRYLALALGRLADARAVPALRESLEDATPATDPQTLIYSAWALGAIGEPAAVLDLLKLARSEDAGLRKAAVHALGAFPSAETQAALRAALDDPVEDVRWNAAVALARRRDTAAAPVLLLMMDRSHLATLHELEPAQREDAIVQAVKAAAVVPDPSLRAALERLRDSDPNLQVRDAAQTALQGAPRAEGAVLTDIPAKVE